MRLQRVSSSMGTLAVAVCLAALCGCAPNDGLWSLQYAIGAAGGELNYVSRAVPIQQALTDPDLTQEQRDKLQLVIDARDYAQKVIGLNVGSSYQTFVNLHGQVLAYNVSASRKDAIEAYTWNLPVVGTIAYLGFFNKSDALAERDYLVSQGYDTFMYDVDAFSTLGYLPDPVSSKLLERTVPNLADTVVHELLHNTIWAPGNDRFSESLATFVGRTGGMEFLKYKFGADSAVLQQATEAYEDGDLIQEFLNSVATYAKNLYAQKISSQDKIAQRDRVFQAARQRFANEIKPQLHNPDRYAGYATFQYNNAFLLVNVRYNSDLSIFSRTYESVNRDWSAALSIFREAARASDPIAFLQSHLDGED